MTPFTLEWTDQALNELAALWIVASDPQSMTQAQATIDSLLRRGPLHHGMELSEGLRALNVPPLRVLYSVDPSAQFVEICGVRWTP